MEPVRKSLLERFFRGDTVPGTQSSHHLLPVSTSQIANKLFSEDDSYIGNHDFDLPTIPGLSEITPSAYVTYIYDSFWLDWYEKWKKNKGMLKLTSCTHMVHITHLIGQHVMILAMCLYKKHSLSFENSHYIHWTDL